MAPFLSIITRHMPGRKEFLLLNRASLWLQTDQDFEQIVMEDDQGRGWEYVQQMLIEASSRVKGDYVMILDDDDVMINALGVELLRVAVDDNPAGVIFKTWHNEMGVLPENGYWQRQPESGHIGSCSFILRRDIFNDYIKRQPPGHYASDFDLIASVYRDHPKEMCWLDKLMCWVIRQSRGRPD
jgi:hypothetical protein